MGKLYLALLGTPTVRHGDAALTFPTRKALALLVYLAVEGGRHSRETLTALFWPDSDRQHGRAMLRYTLAGLRRALGDTADAPHLAVERDALGLDFSSGVEIDLHALQVAHLAGRAEAVAAMPSGATPTALADLQHAAALWRGEFLEGLSLPDAPEFEHWASLQRESWRQKMERVLDQLSQLRADRGELTEAIEATRRWVALNPVNEAAHRRLMRLYLSAGDRTAALRAYETCRATLEAELQVAPAPETESLAERIRTAEPYRPEFPGEPVAPSTPHLPFEGPLVGRSDEFVKLVELYHAARRGRHQVAILRGEPGIGKTRLAKELLAWAAGHGADVLEGRAFETGGRLPFQPLVDALRPRLDRENAPEDLLSDVWLTELGRLLPELRDRYPDLPVPAGDEAAARARLFEAVARLGQAQARRAPVVLFVDDLQWADAGSLDVLHYTGRRWAESGTPLLLLLGLRAEALADTPALDEWLVGLRRDLVVTELELGPLTARDTLHLLEGFGTRARRSGQDRPAGPELERLARWLFAETSGQPFFAVEIIRELLERGALVLRAREDGEWELDPRAGIADPAALGSVLPPGMREVIRARLARLARPARELLAAAAVLGQGFTFEQVCRVARLGEDEALPAADAVVRAHLLREAEADRAGPAVGAYFFTHDKIRDVAYAEAGEARRQIFHRRALEALDSVAPAAQLVRHALAAGLEEPAVQFSLAAGDEAMRLLAARDALAFYDRAMQIAERLGWSTVMADLHARRGKAYASVARWAEARRELELSLGGLGEDRPEQRAEVLLDLTGVCYWATDTPSARRCAAEAVILARAFDQPHLEARALGWLAACDSSDGELGPAIDGYQRAIARAGELGCELPASQTVLYSVAMYWAGRINSALQRINEDIDLARRTNDTQGMMLVLGNRVMYLGASGRYAEAARALEDARRFSHDYGVESLLARAIVMLGGSYLDVCGFAAAEALAEEGRQLARSAAWMPTVVSGSIDLLLNFARRGEPGRAEELVDEVAAAVAKTAGFHGWLWSLRLAEARAEIALARGNREEALRRAGEAIEQSHARQRVKYEVIGLTTRAEALRALGRAKEAIADLRRAVALARPIGDPVLFLRPVSGLLAVDGDDSLAAEAGAVVQQISGALPDAEMRRRFEAAEPVRMAVRLTAQRRGAVPGSTADL
ncbi:MAG: AAA family ATPase [Chloroflexota bacterium]|nr:AAA family ATPase [Chloroflexota bacterium]